MAYAKRWNELRSEDCGILLEHLALDILRVSASGVRLFFWRDKQKHEIDFVIQESANKVHAVECKWSSDEFTVKNLAAFRDLYPTGKNFCIVGTAAAPRVERKIAGHTVIFVDIQSFTDVLN